MPDVDTDGGLWFQWYMHFIDKKGLIYEVTDRAGYPFGYDISLTPTQNLIYDIQLLLLRLIGFHWSNLILVTNLSSLITYPLSALFAAMLAFYLTKSKGASFIAGLLFGFSFYHVFMGRGQMSINHIEVIPLYFLSLLHFLNGKNLFRLILSCLVFSILFKVDPYYAFFSGLFTPIFLLFYGKTTLTGRTKTLVIYYVILFIVLITTNFSYILSNLYLFNTDKLILTGRISTPKQELDSIMYYFFPIRENILYDTPFWIIYSIPMLLIMAGGVFLKMHPRMFILLLTCILLGIVLSTYVPSFYLINELYFKFFAMFRSVGRIILPTYLFIGIAAAFVFASLEIRSTNNNKKYFYYALIVLMGFVILISSMSRHESWYRSTNFEKTAQVYTELAQNKDIQTIAAYPIQLNFTKVGFPQTYQLMGQIVHEKPFANGVGLESKEAYEYNQKIWDISKPITIDHLTTYNIDTIVIYNNFLDNAYLINNQLKKDKRLKFIGNFKKPFDPAYISGHDLSRDISIYQIREVVNKKTSNSLFEIISSSGKLEYKKISAYSYVITLSNIRDKDRIVYRYPYTPKLNLYAGNYSSVPEGYFISLNDMVLSSHKRFDEAFNCWELTIDEITKKNKMTIRKNKDNTYSATLTMFYTPYALTSIGNTLSNISFAIFVVILIIYKVKPVRL